MPNTNKNLNTSKKYARDEFYTQYNDIENELQYYIDNFTNKIVYCNCDNPKYSNFYKYFKNNFKKLKLKKLICTYKGNNPSVTVYENEIEMTYPIKSGDFRSQECIDILKKSDIIVTNPPFSLFREFVHTLNQYNKQYLIIGNLIAINYKTIFPLFVKNQISIGVNCGTLFFKIPHKEYTNQKIIIKNGQYYVYPRNTRWFTNMPYTVKKYINCIESSDKYNKYDTYDAIDIPKVAKIPKDYDGIMGVPTSFVDKYSSEQFEIIGLLNHGKGNNEYDFAIPYINGKMLFPRILIRHK